MGRTSRLVVLACSFVLLAVVCVEAKDRAWQTGKVLDSGETNTLYGVGSQGVFVGQTLTYQTYTIEGGDYVYTVKERMPRNPLKPVDLTVGKPLKAIVEKGSLYFLGDSGKEHKTVIVKKVIRNQKD